MRQSRSRSSKPIVGPALLILSALTAQAAEIRGSVLDAAGQPVPAATVRIEPAERDLSIADDGTFVADGLEEGRYTLRAIAAGYAMTTRTVDLRGDVATIEVRLHPVLASETVTVSPSYSLLERRADSGISMGRRDIENLPHFGDDLFRAIAVLPSTTANDVSSRFSVRGGLQRENLVLLDGLEIFEPAHLKDFEGALSIFDPGVIGGADLYAGAFPAKYGDRASGVLDMSTLVPSERSNTLGLSLSNLWYATAGSFDGGNGNWLASIRRGYLDIIMDLAGANDDPNEEESPGYMDAFGRVSWWITPRQSLAVNLLFADDTLDLREQEAEEDIDATTGYGNWHVWVTHRALPTPKLLAQTVFALGHLDRDRRVVGLDNGDAYVIRDVRDTDVLTLKQGWIWEPSPRHALEWGFETRRYDTTYDYESTVDIERAFADPRFRDPMGVIDYDGAFEGEYHALHLSERFRPTDRFSTQVGLRYDKSTLTDDGHLAPRVNLLWNPSQRDALNLGWGHVYQSHRTYELDVQDGETEFFPAERAEHLVLGYERELGRGWSFRAEAYRREISDPRVRYENLFDPLGQFPEASYDRVEIAATEATAQGIELFLRGPDGKKFDWWASYVYSEVVDRVGGRDQKRWFDQPHAVTLNANYKPAPRWNLNAVWLFHTGWPTTRVTAEQVVGPAGPEIVPSVGPFYDERLPAYHRLDMRASYTKQFRKSRLQLFIDVQNLYGRKNRSGSEYDAASYVLQPDGSVRVVPEKEEWLGIMPSFGLTWEF